MKPTQLLLTLVLPAVALATTTNINDTINDGDIGTWTVGDCILVQFAMAFDLHANASNPNATTSTILVAPDAKLSSYSCGNMTQEFKLSWAEQSRNHTGLLHRNVTITFARKNTTL